MSRSTKPIAIFLGITLTLSSIFYLLIIQAGTLQAGSGLYVYGLMWCPGVSALITLKVLGRSWKELGWKRGRTRYQLSSYGIPILYALVAYGAVWGLGAGRFYSHEFVATVAINLGMEGQSDGTVIALLVLLEGTVSFLIGCVFALGEEIGWRGFLVPALYGKYGFAKTSVITGLIWGLWHAPILLFADYNNGAPVVYALACFLLLVVSISFVYTWFRIRSGSLWTAVILHASHNLFIQSIFTPLTEDTGNTAYFIDEFGIALPIVAIALAYYFWSRRHQLPPVSAAL
ncbi:MAG TPA: CPBP family intramembrane metalloprotease domain-containing protein [Cytophagales bacterium]|nr:CPBP family intramembrane metalloprotease domain-containing protein [Cytophagales bacterium]